MQTVKVSKSELISKLVSNRALHVAEYEAAKQGHRRKTIESHKAALAELEAGKPVNAFRSLPEPQDHTKEYDRALSMLGMSVEDTIELQEHEFDQLVMDNWTWKVQSKSLHALYTHE